MKKPIRRRVCLTILGALLVITAASWIRSIWFNDVLTYHWSHVRTQTNDPNAGFCIFGHASGRFGLGLLWELRESAPDRRSFQVETHPASSAARFPWFRYKDIANWAVLGVAMDDYRSTGLHVRNFMVPHWLPALALVASIALLIRRDSPHRRRARGHCPTCAYDLQANFAPGCPECGWNRPSS